jgi:FAD:protein FMN transferase
MTLFVARVRSEEPHETQPRRREPRCRGHRTEEHERHRLWLDHAANPPDGRWRMRSIQRAALTGMALWVAVGLCCFVAWPQVPVLTRHSYSADAMGGTFLISIYAADGDMAGQASADAFVELRRIEALLSNYRPESEWSRVNRFAAERPVALTGELFDLIAACLVYSRKSEGAFDITVGPLMKTWGFYQAGGRLADPAELERARAEVGYRHVRLDPRNRTIAFSRPGVELDPGGIGKGYAVDRMAAVLKYYGVQRALISAAGSTILALGTPPGEAGWPVHVGDSQKEAPMETVRLKNESLSTSGIAERHFQAGGRTYGHILDPRTGLPVQGVFSVSVRAPQAVDSEAWTKAFFVNGRRWSLRNRPQGFQVYFCENEGGRRLCRWLK